jgi:hypothetical protein
MTTEINVDIQAKYILLLFHFNQNWNVYTNFSKPHFFFQFVRWDFRYCGHYWPIVPAPDDRRGGLWRNWWNKDWQGKPKYSEKTCSSATLSTTNPPWTNPVLNPGRRGEKPATNRLTYGPASVNHLIWSLEEYLVSCTLLIYKIAENH